MAVKISEAELEIMEILWRRSPLSAAEVAERVHGERDWSMQTVKTLLSRLAAKSAVSHERDGRRFRYSPTVGRDDYVTEESRRLVDRLFGGRVSPLVAHLAKREDLSAKDIDEIEQLLKDLRS
ncbi:BlaI/MecI/CopY family transcriptional regulator [Parasphingopyxis algicola]|uniref:BlaI/MecI/CopY family transcriptional regulator n=1 Tax=Parasphingopyxis algicola TaxID=2026624 RepID=UPI0015A45F84|nr:BlaI/MecI/CopY family transcriptional regulator [Parasphingopyxis algicola]QLC24678.1 BlaI/MecI/CopY family transcriptional regulator [Parasphingopyxis algicola]